MKNIANTVPYIFAGLVLVNVFALFGLQLFYIASAFTLAYLLLVPGFILLSFLAKRPLPLFLGLSLSATLSVFALMILGLAINTLLPFVGITQPLTTISLLLTLDAFMVVALPLAQYYKNISPIELPTFTAPSWILSAGGLLLPVLVCLGSISLNDGGSNIFVMSALALAALFVVVLVLRHRELDHEVAPLMLYMMALAFLLMSSMRGWFVTGHDIQLEYHVFELAQHAHFWDIAFYQDPYNACLSLTILPVFLQNLIHVPDIYIYKLVLQFIGALPVVPLFYLVKRYSATRIAYLTSFLYISFPTYLTDMAFLNRQGIAFLFFFMLVYVLLCDDYIEGRMRSVLLYVLGIGMILSHYSTSYVAIGLFVGAYLLNRVLRFIMTLKRPKFVAWLTNKIPNKESYKKPILLTFPFVLTLIVAAVVWSAGITKTSQSITATLESITASLIHPYQDDVQTGVTKYSIVQKPQSPLQKLFNSYVQQSVQSARTSATDSNFYPQSIVDQYPVVPLDEPTSPLTPLGQTIQSSLSTPLSVIYDNTKQAYAIALQVLILIGLTALSLGYAFRMKLLPEMPVEYIALTISGLALIVIQTVLPSGAIDYGLLRLFQQNLIFLAFPISLVTLFVLRFVTRSYKIAYPAYALILVACFLTFSGFIPELTGGSRAALPLNNSGFYYDTYYTHGQEVSALQWFASVDTNNTPVQSDRYFSSIKMIAYANIYPDAGLLPETIRRDSYVYLNYKNVHSGEIVEYINGEVVYYTFPLAFLDDTKALIYTNGGSDIYR